MCHFRSVKKKRKKHLKVFFTRFKMKNIKIKLEFFYFRKIKFKQPILQTLYNYKLRLWGCKVCNIGVVLYDRKVLIRLVMESLKLVKLTIKYITGDDLEIFKLIFNNKTVCIFVFKQFKNGFNLMFNFYVDIVFI